MHCYVVDIFVKACVEYRVQEILMLSGESRKIILEKRTAKF